MCLGLRYKNMKKLLLFLILLPSVTLHAYDFQWFTPGGQTLYFDTVPGGVSVVYPHEGSYADSWNGFDKPTGVLTIPSHVTWQGVTYPVVSVGAAAFYNCGGLTAVIISHGVTTLGNSAFVLCTSLDSVSLPASITSIGSQAFGGCSSLTSVSIFAGIPPTTALGAFYNTSLESCILYVPCESDSIYSASAPWSGFGNVVAMPCAVTVSAAVNDAGRGVVTGAGTYPFGSSVTLSATPTDGYAFICWNDGNTQNPRLLEATDDISLVAMFFPLIHDTIVVDLTPDFYRLQVLSDNVSLGLGVGSATLSEGTVAEVCALPLEGGRFAGWSDGVNVNPRHVTVTGDMTLTALFDRVGVGSPEAVKWSVSTVGQTIEVRCPEGMNVVVYDMSGRIVASAFATSTPLLFNMSAKGTYVVSVDGTEGRKVVVD